MPVKIRRKDTSWIGKFSPLKVTLNGEKVTEIYNEEENEITLPKEKMILSASMASNEIEVTDKDEILITNRTLNTSIYTVFFILILLLPLLASLNNSFSMVNIPTFIYISLGILFALIMLVSGYKLYHIENVTRELSNNVD